MSANVIVSDDSCNVPCFNERLVTKLKRRLPPEDAVEETRSLFAALADRARLKIIHALREGEELCVCDVAHVLDVSISTASHHLRKLRDLKFLRYRNDGKMAYYRLRDEFAAKLVEAALEKPTGVGNGTEDRTRASRTQGVRPSASQKKAQYASVSRGGF